MIIDNPITNVKEIWGKRVKLNVNQCDIFIPSNIAFVYFILDFVISYKQPKIEFNLSSHLLNILNFLKNKETAYV